MPLTPPRLDSRTFKDLMDEAKARLPRYTPEWVNFNESDPGMALVQLHAWMTETILYELNRVPELNYLKFLDLLGIVPEPARPARTELEFTLKNPEQITVNIPRLTQVAVNDPASLSEVLFETDRTLTAIDAAIGAVIYPKDTSDGAQTHSLVTRFAKGQTVWAHNFDPFPVKEYSQSEISKDSDYLYIGLHLRPGREKHAEKYTEDRFPVGPLDLFVDAVQVHDKGAGPDASVIKGPIGTLCPAPGSSGLLLDPISWEVFTGVRSNKNLDDDPDKIFWSGGWKHLALSEDGTRALSGSGHLVFEIPETIKALNPIKLKQDFWASFGGVRPPQTLDDLRAQLKAHSHIVEGLRPFWKKMGATDAEFGELAACGLSASAVGELIKNKYENNQREEDSPFAACELSEEAAPSVHEDDSEGKSEVGDTKAFDLKPAKLTLADWLEVSDIYYVALPQNDNGFLPLYWIRGKLKALSEKASSPSTLRGFQLNTVSATQAATRFGDQLGRSNGRPEQVFKLAKVPVLIDPETNKPDLELEIIESGQAPKWVRVDDFYNSGPEDPHYVLDPVKGEIRLGDGRRGRIPVAGSTVTAVRYRVGGGAMGNVSAGLVSKLKGALKDVQSVTNRRAAHDGSDAETLEEVKARAPQNLRVRDRAVSAEDFADLAMRTPGVALHRVFALSHRAVVKKNSVLKQEMLIRQNTLIRQDPLIESDKLINKDTLLEKGTLIRQDTLVEKDGAVTLLVLPKLDQLMPQPDENQKRAIGRWLEPRRLITTELHIIGPRYVLVTELQAKLKVRRDYDLGSVVTAVKDVLTRFLSPVYGGEAGTGWPFESDIYYGDLYEQILSVPGVRRAAGLKVKIQEQEAAEGFGGADMDVVKMPTGCLPALSRDVIELVAGYE